VAADLGSRGPHGPLEHPGPELAAWLVGQDRPGPQLGNVRRERQGERSRDRHGVREVSHFRARPRSSHLLVSKSALRAQALADRTAAKVAFSAARASFQAAQVAAAAACDEDPATT
jgi:hypothetical protein